MRVVVGFDHSGVVLRAAVIIELIEIGCEVLDLGTDSSLSVVDVIEKTVELSEAITDGDVERGILVTASGVGSAIAATGSPGSAPASATTRSRHAPESNWRT